jgi:hypothetical protein
MLAFPGLAHFIFQADRVRLAITIKTNSEPDWMHCKNRDIQSETDGGQASLVLK